MSNRSITNERYTNQQIAACLFIERHKFQDNIFATNSNKKNMYYILCSILCIILLKSMNNPRSQSISQTTDKQVKNRILYISSL